MDFEDFRETVQTDIVDFQSLNDFFKDYKKPRDKIVNLVQQGKLIRIKKGLYVFGAKWRRGILDLRVIANVLYGPSYVSYEYALYNYGFLIERPTVVTSATLGSNKQFQTAIGLFEYKSIPKNAFKIGVEYVTLGDQGGYFIASKEKALVDLVYRTKGITSKEKLRFFLFEEMRIDPDLFENLNFGFISELEKAYDRHSLRMLGKI